MVAESTGSEASGEVPAGQGEAESWLDDEWTRDFGLMLIAWFVAMVLASALLLAYGGLILRLLG